MDLCADKIGYTLSSTNRNVFELDLGYKKIDFTFCQLLTFRKKILDNSSEVALIEILNNENFILLFVADNKHLIYLDVPQLLELRALVLGVFKPKSSKKTLIFN